MASRHGSSELRGGNCSRISACQDRRPDTDVLSAQATVGQAGVHGERGASSSAETLVVLSR